MKPYILEWRQLLIRDTSGYALTITKVSLIKPKIQE